MFLGIDVGTGSLKAAMVRPDGSVAATAEASYAAPSQSGGRADFDPNIWWEAVRSVVRDVTSRAGSSAEAIAVTAQMHGVVLVDERGRPVRDAILWPDFRADDVLDSFTAFHLRHPGVLGNPIVPGMAGPILAWLALHEPDALTRASHAVQPKDWIRMRLCGGAATTDPSDASGTLLYDITTDDWSEALCAAVGVPRDLLAPIHASHSVIGSLEESAARELGLEPGIPVALGAGDAPSALLGAGVEEPGTMLINTGTGAQIMTPVTAPTISDAPSAGLQQFRSASDATRWYAMAAVVNGGLAIDWVRRLTGYEWDRVYALAADVMDAPYEEDPVFLPFLSREREPQRSATGGAWAHLGLGTDHDALVRSAVRGVALYIGLRTHALMERTDVDSIIIAGGASRHRSWVELVATILGSPVTVASDPHLTVRGAAILAARAVGRNLPVSGAGTHVEPRTGCNVEGWLGAFQAAAAGP